MRQIFGYLLFVTFLACASGPVSAKDIAVCGASRGYGFYPKAGLVAASKDAGAWHGDAISKGKFTLSQVSDKDFDLLVTDATGRVFSAKQEGGIVVLVGARNKVVTVIVDYPATTVVETYTFLRNANGKAEAIWTSNKGGGAAIMKVAAYRADCSFFLY